MTASRRSYLFVPGNRPERFPKALAAGADAVIVDLEDAVAPDDKHAARDAVANWLSAEHPVILRINAAETPWFSEDLGLLKLPGVSAVLLPKAESAQQIAEVHARTASDGRGMPVLALIESALGLRGLHALAESPVVECLALGTIDLQVDLGMSGATDADLLPFMLDLVVASRLAGLGKPVDGVSTSLDDEAGLRADVLRARRLGVGGKPCIHSRQVPIVNRGLSPSADEVAWAERVLAAASLAGGGATALDGRMVDKPVILRAQTLLQEARR